MDQRKLNSDIMKGLTDSQAKELMLSHRCLACIVGNGKHCGISGFSLRCLSGHYMWMESVADDKNWEDIRESLHI